MRSRCNLILRVSGHNLPRKLNSMLTPTRVRMLEKAFNERSAIEQTPGDDREGCKCRMRATYTVCKASYGLPMQHHSSTTKRLSSFELRLKKKEPRVVSRNSARVSIPIEGLKSVKAVVLPSTTLNRTDLRVAVTKRQSDNIRQ